MWVSTAVPTALLDVSPALWPERGTERALLPLAAIAAC